MQHPFAQRKHRRHRLKFDEIADRYHDMNRGFAMFEDDSEFAPSYPNGNGVKPDGNRDGKPDGNGVKPDGNQDKPVHRPRSNTQRSKIDYMNAGIAAAATGGAGAALYKGLKPTVRPPISSGPGDIPLQTTEVTDLGETTLEEALFGEGVEDMGLSESMEGGVAEADDEIAVFSQNADGTIFDHTNGRTYDAIEGDLTEVSLETEAVPEIEAAVAEAATGSFWADAFSGVSQFFSASRAIGGDIASSATSTEVISGAYESMGLSAEVADGVAAFAAGDVELAEMAEFIP